VYPEYELRLDSKLLLAAKKMNTIGSAHYMIAMNKDSITKDASSYLGKVRGGNSEMEYNIFDSGENPAKHVPYTMIRTQLGGVYYVIFIYHVLGAWIVWGQGTKEDKCIAATVKGGWKYH